MIMIYVYIILQIQFIEIFCNVKYRKTALTHNTCSILLMLTSVYIYPYTAFTLLQNYFTIEVIT